MTSNPVSATENKGSEAERRQLTLMFCDLVDSTGLAQRLDPEEYRDVIDLYQRTCDAVIERFEGRVAQYLGDGLLVYFGYPVAHEDDARRGVLSALGVLEALEPLNRRLERERGLTLALRQGIHTGLVVVGEMGRRGRQEQLAVGEAPNVAARLHNLAAPGTVLISAATHRLVQGFFTCEDLGPRTIKGLSAPLHVYRVVGESGAQSRLESTGLTRLTPLVGREHESETLLDRWARVRAGVGQVVLLSGEAGVGKSRLVAALKEHVAKEGEILLECRCSPYHQQTTLYPLIDTVQRMLRWRRSDSPIERLDTLEAILALFRVPLPDVVPLLAAVLALPLPEDRYPPLTLTPPRQRARTLEALFTILRCITAQRPLLLITEDAHWVDPTTLEFLTLLLSEVAPPRLLTIVTFRREFRPQWDARDDHTDIVLGPLAREETIAMITRVANNKRLPAPVLDQLLANTDGNPLFVEELTKTVLESGLLREAENGYEMADIPLTLAIPATLHDSLIARLDHLGSAKAVAQVAAILGRTFPYELLQAVSPVDTPTLEAALDRLVEAGLLYPQGPVPIGRYQFKHALVQEAAYQSLLRSTRQQTHQRVAQTLAEKFSEIAETQPELVAHHYTEAGLGALAIPYWQRAGQRAVERSAYREAISHLTRGLGLLSQLPEGPQRIQHEIGLQITLGAPLMAVRGYTAQDVEKVFGRARELCRQIGETPQLFTALRGLRQYYQIRGDSQTAFELSEQLLRLAERAQDSALLMEAHNALGAALFWMSYFGPAHDHFNRVIGLYDPQVHRSHAFFYANDPGVVASSYAAWTLWYLGYTDQSLQRLDRALALARELAHPFSLAVALAYGSSLHYFRRASGPAREWAEQAIALATEHGFPFWLAQGTMVRGWALTEQGRVAEGIAELRQGLTTWRGHTELARPSYLTMLAQGLARAGQSEEAFAALNEAMATVSGRADRTFDAVDVYHLKAELLLAQGEPKDAEAEACLRRAIEIAGRQGAKPWELRATLTLSHLLERQGKRAEAHRNLAAIYGWFTEGLDSADARAARALLQRLG